MLNLIESLGKNYENLPKILEHYDKIIEQAEELFDVKGKRLELAMKENVSLLHYYDQQKVVLHSLVKFFKAEEDKVRGELFKSYKENYDRALGEREINRYIDAEKRYLNVHTFLIEVEERYELMASIIEVLKHRAYAFNNITRLRIAELEFVEL